MKRFILMGPLLLIGSLMLGCEQPEEEVGAPGVGEEVEENGAVGAPGGLQEEPAENGVIEER